MEIFELKDSSFQENTDNRIIIIILNPELKARIWDDDMVYEPKFVIPISIEGGRVPVVLEDSLGQIVGGPWFDCEFESGICGWWTLLVEKVQ